jgi:hypothetical protein
MTFSNVNPDVVQLNANAVGISDFPAFQKIKLGRLHDLLGHRNEIGHGGFIKAPRNEIFVDLWKFTEDLIADYCAAFTAWMSDRFKEQAKAEQVEPLGRAVESTPEPLAEAEEQAKTEQATTLNHADEPGSEPLAEGGTDSSDHC